MRNEQMSRNFKKALKKENTGKVGKTEMRRNLDKEKKTN